MKGKGILVLVSVAFLVVATFPAYGASGSLKSSFIVRFRAGVDVELVSRHGGKIKYLYSFLPMVAVELPEEAAAALRSSPSVLYVEDDIEVLLTAERLPWGVDRIDAEVVHGYNRGSGVKVAVIDTGIDHTHPDLDDNYLGGYDFANSDNDPMDDNGHGTHVAGIIAAEDNDFGVIGVAPEADLYALKAFGSGGTADLSDILAAIDWSIDNGMQIISMSFGTNEHAQSFQDACNAAYGARIVLVAAAGNDGLPWPWFDTVDYPARYGAVIAVGAVDQSDLRAWWSSTGPSLELAAPGVDVYSTWLGGYNYESGTSMACPHVSGVAALVIAGEPELTNEQVRQRLLDTADPLGFLDEYGWGMVDADEAAPDVGPPPPPPPNQPPVAVAGPDQTLNDADGTGSESVTLDSSGSYDPDGSIVSYEWTEDSTVLGTDALVTTDFDTGTHAVTLTVTDNDGATDSDDVVVTVNPNQGPTADAGPDQTGLVGESLTFDGSGSSDPDGTLVSYVWDFGDGYSDSGVTVQHAFDALGTYTVTLTVTDNGGASGSDAALVSISDAPPPNVMHVERIDMETRQKKSRKFLLIYATATILITDAEGNPVKGVTVYGSWSGLTSDSDSGRTGRDGTVTLKSDTVSSPSGTFTFTVENVVKAQWTYDLSQNNETSDSIGV